MTQNGPCPRTLRIRLVHQPTALTGVVQIFSLLQIPVEELVLGRDAHHPGRADLRCVMLCSDRTLDLVLRRLQKLLEVLEVQVVDDASV